MRSNNCYIDKQLMIGNILGEICTEMNAEKYYDFIQHNRDFLEKWLQAKVVNLISSDPEWIPSITKDVIEKHLDAMQMALRNACTHITNNANVYNRVTFDDWKKEFLKDSALKAPLNIQVFLIENFQLSDIDTYTSKISHLLCQNLEKDCFAGLPLADLDLEDKASELLSKMTKNITQNILAHLQGCDEVCPFCRVNCHLQIGTDHTHKAIFHYSRGVAGCRNIPTTCLTPESCSMLVATDNRYQFDDGPWKDYKKYREEFNDWDITPIRDDMPIDHWKWVLMTFNDFFADRYNAKPADIPDGWKTVTQRQALTSLKEHYKIE